MKPAANINKRESRLDLIDGVLAGPLRPTSGADAGGEDPPDPWIAL
jgi:hypothetical protein